MGGQAKKAGIRLVLVAIALIALGLRAIVLTSDGLASQNFFGLLALPVGVAALMGLAVDRWWPDIRRRRINRYFG